MSILRTSLVVLVVVLGACEVHPDAATASTAPLEVGTDRADHECGVVLRTAQRMYANTDYETDCSSGTCLYVWRGQIDVADSISPDAAVGVLYHLQSDPTWWEVDANLASGAPPGVRRYAFSMTEHLFGPDAPGDAIELVPFVRLPDGSRLFDHNRHPGDFDNAALAPDRLYATSDFETCQPVVGTIRFDGNWNEYTSGARRQGGYLVLDYAIARLPQCRGTHNGYPAWDVVAHGRFLPGGEPVTGSVRQLGTNMGTPTNEASDLPLAVSIPDDAESVELWFENYTGAGSSCQAWDSDYGANYHFDIWPPADDPRCRDVELRNGTHAEDARMYLADPYCLPYQLDAQYDADHCEFHVDGVGSGYVGHYGIPFEWLLAYLAVPAQDGEVLAAGVFTRYHDTTTGQPGQRFSLGRQVSPGVWETGFAFDVNYPSRSFHDTIDDFAFFIDVRRPAGTVVRLWQSRGGANYHWDDAFGSPTTSESIPYGNIQWANDSSTVYESRRSCP